ncbi:Ankyrin repeat family protein [Mycena indigotica]|uniref:Ankyrin repeat family protein n=1 Tax=Mycena indigotica TaxID=2126181 RepID=A0A8H6VV21_9AGAR|nr:Ankyrin repeat family protein [Mycena indigotica]KAF7289314.1 Ankyrin repeat family protein [Mycena indigotica]
MSSSLNKDELTISTEIEDHDSYPHAMQMISVTARHSKHETVASLVAWRLVRSRFGDGFLQMLDEDHEELHQFSTTLFDKYGRVQQHLIEPGYHSGSGCWGKELNVGNLFYIFSVSVKEPFSWSRNRLVDPRQVPAFGQYPRTGHRNLLAVAHGITSVALDALFFFGYSSNNNHPSRRIPVEEDVPALDDNYGAVPDPDRTRLEFPLHAAIHDKSSQVADTIQSYYDNDPSSVHASDANGFTPLHIAAGRANVVAVRKLLSWDMRADLVNVGNVNGVTPLELLKLTMRSDRDFSETILDNWKGYSVDSLEAEFLLKQGMGLPVEGTLERHIEKSRYGCTCGGCIGGWMSPRMRFQLMCQAGYAKDVMPDQYRSFKRGQPADLDDCLLMYSEYIPRRFQSDFFLSFYKGYCELFSIVYDLLESTPEILSAAAVGARFLFNSGFYFQKGGRVEFVFDAITDAAYQQSALGDGEHENTFEDNESWTGLPTCANDLEFRLVRSMLGLNPREEWGPYNGDSGHFDSDSDW